MEKITIITLGPENPCAKCKKTRKNLELMLKEFPEYKEKIDYSHKDISSKEIVEKYGILQGPAVIINDILISQGHVPTIKKIKNAFERLVIKKD
ncbi:MAG: thioredoxin family protein [Promethearchaeota archaeon]